MFLELVSKALPSEEEDTGKIPWVQVPGHRFLEGDAGSRLLSNA